MAQPWTSLRTAIVEGDVSVAVEETRRCLRAGVSPDDVFFRAIVSGIHETGRRWKAGRYQVPDVILSAEAFRAAVRIVEGCLSVPIGAKQGKVVIGVVQGDIHDLGKGIVTAVLQGAGFKVIDLGVDVSADQFVRAVRCEEPDIVGLGSYLSATMRQVQEVLDALEEAGLRASVKTMIGGISTTQSFADHVGADAWAPDAAASVVLAKRLVHSKRDTQKSAG